MAKQKRLYAVFIETSAKKSKKQQGKWLLSFKQVKGAFDRTYTDDTRRALIFDNGRYVQRLLKEWNDKEAAAGSATRWRSHYANGKQGKFNQFYWGMPKIENLHHVKIYSQSKLKV